MNYQDINQDPVGRIQSYAQGGIGWIVLDNPKKRNAISKNMWTALIAALASFDLDPNVRCVIIRGEGNKAFCAGGDISEKERDQQAGSDLDDQNMGLKGLESLRRFSKPSIAMIDGYCLGAGFAIALACDLRYSSTAACFGVPAAKLGLAYHYSEVRRLTQLLGPARAMEMLYTAERIAGEEAYAVGLVNATKPQEELAAFVLEVARLIASNAPLSIGAAKLAVATALSDQPADGMLLCAERARICRASDDHVEGLRAFREKRRPDFKGR